MHIKTLVSAGALAIALGLGSTAVIAQEAAAPTMIGNQQLTEADATRVQTYCDDLKTQSEQTAGTGSDSEDTAESTDTGETDGGQAAIGGVDLDMVTIENCADAGFIEGPVTPTTTN
nr:hypothetical protein [uncultured Devosia sp.]